MLQKSKDLKVITYKLDLNQPLIDEDKDADLAILTLEADVLPGEDVAEYIAEECDVDQFCHA